MKDYFLLQYTMTNRKLADWGINPFVAYVLMVVGFIFLSEYLYSVTEFAGYVVLVVALSVLTNTSETQRNNFLLIVFGNSKYRKIRIIENVCISLPFSILLFYHNAFIESIALLTVAVVLAGLSFKANLNFAIPTPFYKKPFEFTVGFRNTFYLLPLAYALTVIALSVGNFNLGIFSMLLVVFISLTYYAKPENEYFVWSYAVKSPQFIFNKIKTGTVYTTFLALPILIAMVMFYPLKADEIVLFTLISLSFLWVTILAKYAAYPNQMGLPEAVLIAMCVYYPPLLIAVIPYFYYKSIKKLNILLK
ncbi:MAG: hypothetical protein M0D57_20995 [Sphingobacteriales bacterium JAD_PAG50586_3]|nr:MAG: hypothetical protein M0D57_20995 [Sphingobacteriales bacterium JAD_PAG50586_3]